MPHAVVRWFDADRGFGFLAVDDGDEDLFVHASGIVTSGGAPKVLREGQSVEFELGEGDRGPQALNVRVTGDAAPDAEVGVLGTVVWYEPRKGYGFVDPDDGGPQVFVHSTSIVTGGVVAEGQRVAFLRGEGERGPQAEHVLPLATSAGRPDAPVDDDGADGTVLWYEDGKGFGFITPDDGGDDVFVHHRSLVGGIDTLYEGDRVTFEAVRGDKGLQARQVALVRGPGRTGGRSSAPSGRRGGPDRGPAGDRRGPAGDRHRSADGPVRNGEGTVARFDADRGFGFITPDAGGADLFVHVSVVAGGEPLNPGDRVGYAVRQSDRGPQADRVELL